MRGISIAVLSFMNVALRRVTMPENACILNMNTIKIRPFQV
jgi:hypothetical protein